MFLLNVLLSFDLECGGFVIFTSLYSFHQLPYNKMYPLSTDGAQPGRPSLTSRNGHQTGNPSQPPAAETQKIFQPASARPRPDHLPLGSPDPKAHPLYLGVASLTGNLV